jgi:hypothetical protein
MWHRGLLRDLIIVFLCGGLLFGVGVWVGQSNEPVTVHAQSPTPEGYFPYGISSAAYGNGHWYALKLNHQSGEVWVLDSRNGSSDDKWKILPEEKRRNT